MKGEYRGGIFLAFERKKVIQQDKKDSYWQILQWVLLILPVLYFIFVFPTVFQSENNEPVTLQHFAVLLFHTFNLVLGGLLMYTPPIERSKNGVGNNMLKIMMVQQLITQNIFGLGLAAIAWYKLPLSVPIGSVLSDEKEPKYLKPKTILIVTSIITVLSVLMMIAVYMFN